MNKEITRRFFGHDFSFLVRFLLSHIDGNNFLKISAKNNKQLNGATNYPKIKEWVTQYDQKNSLFVLRKYDFFKISTKYSYSHLFKSQDAKIQPRKLLFPKQGSNITTNMLWISFPSYNYKNERKGWRIVIICILMFCFMQVPLAQNYNLD